MYVNNSDEESLTREIPISHWRPSDYSGLSDYFNICHILTSPWILTLAAECLRRRGNDALLGHQFHLISFPLSSGALIHNHNSSSGLRFVVKVVVILFLSRCHFPSFIEIPVHFTKEDEEALTAKTYSLWHELRSSSVLLAST